MDKDVNAHRCSYIEREKPILLDSMTIHSHNDFSIINHFNNNTKHTAT